MSKGPWAALFGLVAFGLFLALVPPAGSPEAPPAWALRCLSIGCYIGGAVVAACGRKRERP